MTERPQGFRPPDKMPTYDYVCEKCGQEFEVFQSMKDPRLEDCLSDECDGRMRRKIGTGAGVIFKGSGFYETDYRSDSYKAAAKKDAGGTPDSGASGDSGGGAEKKPAAEKTKKSSESSGSGTGSGTSSSAGKGGGGD